MPVDAPVISTVLRVLTCNGESLMRSVSPNCFSPSYFCLLPFAFSSRSIAQNVADTHRPIRRIIARELPERPVVRHVDSAIWTIALHDPFKDGVLFVRPIEQRGTGVHWVVFRRVMVRVRVCLVERIRPRIEQIARQ